MKTKFLSLCMLFLLPKIALAQQRLEILYTNDTHSCVFPLSNNLADTTLAGRGGYLRRLELIKQERKSNPSLLLFDCGDFSQGSPYYTLFKGDVEVGLMNIMGYDVVTLGNHEFDFGLDNLARLLKMAKFSVVCCNYSFKNTPLDGLVKPYVVEERAGLRIGILGVGPMPEGLIDEKNCKGITYREPFEAVREIVDILRNKEMCDVVICLSHLGWDDSYDKGDKKLIKNTSGIDLVLGGHSHTFFNDMMSVENSEGESVAVDQNGKQGVYVGKICIDFQ